MKHFRDYFVQANFAQFGPINTTFKFLPVESLHYLMLPNRQQRSSNFHSQQQSSSYNEYRFKFIDSKP